MGEVKRQQQIPGPPAGPERVPPPLGPDAQKRDCVTSQIQHKLLWVPGCLWPSPSAFLSVHVGAGEKGSWLGAPRHPLDCPLPANRSSGWYLISQVMQPGGSPGWWLVSRCRAEALSVSGRGVGRGSPGGSAGWSHSPHTEGLGWERQTEAFEGALQFPTAWAGAEGSRAGRV